jgi:S-adenosylmethionine:tRNA ribosyltransferase-isomerase
MTIVSIRSDHFEFLMRTRGTPTAGEKLGIPEATESTIELLQSLGAGLWRGRFAGSLEALEALLTARGKLPLPPYIRRDVGYDPRDALDEDRYQTVFAASPGAAAAPTAGLHLTNDLLTQIRSRGTSVAKITLHVGLGTFKPVHVADIRTHRMHAESFHLPSETADAVRQCRERGGRVLAVGTTVARVLEAQQDAHRCVRAGYGETYIYIHPPRMLHVVDGLLTNFHAPDSTLMLLVSAFAGRDRILAAYSFALRSKFRFLSYGDATFIS